MRTLTFLTILSFATLSFGTSLTICERVFIALAEPDAELIDNRGDIVFWELQAIAYDRRKADNRPVYSDTGYQAAVRPAEAGETLHSPDKKKGRRVTHDTKFVLKIPPPQERIVWPELTPNEKRRLIAKLEETFRKGEYDTGLADQSEKSLNFFLNIVGGEKNGIDPFYLLEVASNKEPAGVCRHGNCALVGLLAQIGATSKHVRLVSGYSPDRKERHMWFEYRLDEEAPWITGDATPMNGNVGREPEQLSKKYDESFPRDRQFHDVFFRPTN